MQGARAGATLKRFSVKLRPAEGSNGIIYGVLVRMPPNGTLPVDPADAPVDVSVTDVMALRPHNDGTQIVDG